MDVALLLVPSIPPVRSSVNTYPQMPVLEEVTFHRSRTGHLSDDERHIS